MLIIVNYLTGLPSRKPQNRTVMLRKKNYKVKSLSEQKQIVADRATIGIRLLQGISIATLSGFIIAWLLGQLGMDEAHKHYYHFLGLGFFAGASLAICLEDQIEKYCELATLFVIEKEYKSWSFAWVLFALIGFLVLSIGGSYASREDIAARANKYVGKDISKATGQILSAVKDTMADKATGQRMEELAQIDKSYDELIAASKESAKKARREGKEADAIWLEVGNVAKLERKRQQAKDKVTKQLNIVIASTSANTSKALDLFARMEENRKEEDENERKIMTANAERHKGLIGNAIFISAPLALLLVILRVTILKDSTQNSSQKAKSKSKTKGAKGKPSHSTPPALPKNGVLSGNNSGNSGNKNSPATKNSTTGNKNHQTTSVTGLDIFEYRNLCKNARSNYRNGIMRNSDKALDTAEDYILKLASYGYATKKGKRYNTNTLRVENDDKGLLIDEFHQPTLTV